MSIKVKHEADGSVTVECGGQSVTIQIDGASAKSQSPITIKPIPGKGAGHMALDIPFRSARPAMAADPDATLLDLDETFEVEAAYIVASAD